MPEPVEVAVELRSNPLYLSGMREMVGSIARRLGFSEEACGQMALAVDEALCNVMKHGYGKAHDRPIWIKLTPLGGISTPDAIHKHGNPTTGLKIVLEDEAKQVDPGQIKGRNLDEIRPGGLGVHIIHEVMDEVQYEKRQPMGMRLTMVKMRASTKPVAASGGPAAASGGSTSACCGGAGCGPSEGPSNNANSSKGTAAGGKGVGGTGESGGGGGGGGGISEHGKEAGRV